MWMFSDHLYVSSAASLAQFVSALTQHKEPEPITDVLGASSSPAHVGLAFDGCHNCTDGHKVSQGSDQSYPKIILSTIV